MGDSSSRCGGGRSGHHGRSPRTGCWNSPSPWFGNVAGVLHGGITAVVAGTLLRRVLPAHHADLLHIDVAYLRPLPSDGTPLGAAARVTSRGRRFATVSGTLRTASGRPAALANATFGLG